MALFREMDNVPFKPQAYERAAHTVSTCERPLAELLTRGARSLAELGCLEALGVRVARRGWARTASVINALPVDAMLATSKRHAARAQHDPPRPADRLQALSSTPAR